MLVHDQSKIDKGHLSVTGVTVQLLYLTMMWKGNGWVDPWVPLTLAISTSVDFGFLNSHAGRIRWELPSDDFLLLKISSFHLSKLPRTTQAKVSFSLG